MAEIKNIKSLSELNNFINEEGLHIVKFSAHWCAPCRAQSNIIYELETPEGVEFSSVDVDSLEPLSSFYKISSIPVLIFFKKGKEVKRTVGTQSANELNKIINELI